jgi:RNA polymerase-binding transcription factor DksA
MNALQEKLFLELRQTKEEITDCINKKEKGDWLTAILKEELHDINSALSKLEQGNYGLCEMSGELMPEEMLKNIPTLKSVQDSKTLYSYCKKPIY